MGGGTRRGDEDIRRVREKGGVSGGDERRGPRERTKGIKVGGVACPLAYAGDALGLRREERRRQGGRSYVFIGVGGLKNNLVNVIA